MEHKVADEEGRIVMENKVEDEVGNTPLARTFVFQLSLCASC
jgi:hypothetical protein